MNTIKDKDSNIKEKVSLYKDKMNKALNTINH